MIEALQKVNQSLGLDNFKATIRLSKTDDDSPPLPRWTPEYIEQQLTDHSGKLAKVWVCGPPAMNETFDKTLGQNMKKL